MKMFLNFNGVWKSGTYAIVPAEIYDEVEIALSEALGTRVKVYNGRNKGTLEIEFYTLDDLKNIANAIAK